MLELLKMKKVPHVLPASNIIDYTVSPALVAAHELSPTELHQRDQYLFNFSETTCELVSIDQFLFICFFIVLMVAYIVCFRLWKLFLLDMLRTTSPYHHCRASWFSNTTSVWRSVPTSPPPWRLSSVSCPTSQLPKSIRTSSGANLAQVIPHIVISSPPSWSLMIYDWIGKTSLVALIIQQIKEQYPDAHVVYRFSGISPASSSARQLLQSVYSQVLHPSTSHIIIPSPFRY